MKIPTINDGLHSKIEAEKIMDDDILTTKEEYHWLRCSDLKLHLLQHKDLKEYRYTTFEDVYHNEDHTIESMMDAIKEEIYNNTTE